MPLSTPIDLTKRGLTANAGVTTSLYPHSQQVNETAIRVRSIRVSGADATIVKGGAVSVNDVFPILSIPAGSHVLGVHAKVITAEGGTFTFSVGDTDQTAGYISGANGNTTTNVFSIDESPAALATVYGAGHWYSAAKTIDFLVALGTFTTAVVDVSVTYVITLPFAV